MDSILVNKWRVAPTLVGDKSEEGTALLIDIQPGHRLAIAMKPEDAMDIAKAILDQYGWRASRL
jgi:hypothetical protein